ncbi:hypothetical protein LCGC14_1129360 [marine sediment metagenome]|uniref:Uncharacterized protein n=1 Tax=marine sediment metagenome TaxID=412755 RepID=A0A0F9Q7F4_9ZZZZ
MMVMGFTFIAFSFIYNLGYEPTEQKIKCYDRFSNEIIGETCIEKDFISEESEIILGVGFAFLLSGWIIFLFSDPLESYI